MTTLHSPGRSIKVLIFFTIEAPRINACQHLTVSVVHSHYYMLSLFSLLNSNCCYTSEDIIISINPSYDCVSFSTARQPVIYPLPVLIKLLLFYCILDCIPTGMRKDNHAHSIQLFLWLFSPLSITDLAIFSTGSFSPAV